MRTGLTFFTDWSPWAACWLIKILSSMLLEPTDNDVIIWPYYVGVLCMVDCLPSLECDSCDPVT